MTEPKKSQTRSILACTPPKIQINQEYDINLILIKYSSLALKLVVHLNIIFM